jgi:hypothetical protein
MVYLPRHGGCGNNTLGNTDYCNDVVHGKCLYCYAIDRFMYHLLATNTGVASAYIATIVNIATTSYCHAWQWIPMVARNPNSCNVKLAIVVIPYSNVTFCNHWRRMRFRCNIYLLQPNSAYCNVFSSLRKG